MSEKPILDLEPSSTAPEDIYSLSEDQVDEILGEELGEMKLKPGRIEVIRTDGRSRLSHVARREELRHFAEAFGNSPEDMHEIYGEHEDRSHFYLAVTAGEDGAIRPIGVLRAIEGPLKDSITANTIPDGAKEEGFDLAKILGDESLPLEAKTWDIGTLAIDRQYRRGVGKKEGKAQAGRAGLQLYSALYGDMAREGVEYMTAMLDNRPLKRIRDMGVPLRGFAGVKPGFEYHGSEASSAVIGRVPEFQGSVLKRVFEGDPGEVDINSRRKISSVLAGVAVFAALKVGAMQKTKVH